MNLGKTCARLDGRDLLQGLKTHPHRYENVTLRQLLYHLVTTYAAIDQFDLEKNQEKMTARYNPNAPIKRLFEKITDGVAYTELGDAPFTSKQIVEIALICLAKTGLFNDDLKEWNQKPFLSIDWTTFRVHFAKAHREWKANLRLTAGQHFPEPTPSKLQTTRRITRHTPSTP